MAPHNTQYQSCMCCVFPIGGNGKLIINYNRDWKKYQVKKSAKIKSPSIKMMTLFLKGK